ncbi:MAG TPA: hypothetical protein DHW22_05215 [Planctomycetaceae bacterium]|nr:hypothetical protein [Planctomycetaceae bacterium]
MPPRLQTAGSRAFSIGSSRGPLQFIFPTVDNEPKTMNRSPLLQESSQSHLLAPHRDFDWMGNRKHAKTAPHHLATAAHAFFAPMHYEDGYAYPLIVWIHCANSNEEELHQAMPLVSTRNYVAVAPRGTLDSKTVPGAFTWGQSSSDLAEANERVRDCIHLAKDRYHVHPERIYIAGHAAGGTMAHRIGMENPELFAGAISLGGPVPRGGCPMRNIKQARKLPLMLAVSPQADNYSNEKVMDDLRLLHYAGFSLALRLYPEGDQLTTTMLSDVNTWIMESFCPSSTTVPS